MGLGRKKNLTQRVLIIKHAYSLFLEEGYDAVTTKRIAERCSMAHSLLHYYYLKKDDLLTDVVNTMTAKLYSYMVREGIDRKDKLYVYGLFARTFFEALTVDRRLLGVYQAALADARVLRRWTKYMADKVGLYEQSATEKETLAPYILSGCMSQLLPLYVDCEIDMELRETVNIALELFFTAGGMTRAWTQATIGLIDRRVTPPFVRGFLEEFQEMMAA